MKHSFLFLCVLTISLLSCKKQIEMDYCQMLHLDQTLEDEDRREVFKSNLYKIIDYSKVHGFPEMGSLKASGLDSCRNWAVMITLFHVGQTQPKLFFQSDIAPVLTKEIEQGRLRSRSLFAPLREGLDNHIFCESNKNHIYQLLKTWNLDTTELPTIRFETCTK